jgi:hypothetical protein
MKKTLILLFSLLLLVPSLTYADGVIFPPPDYWMYETDQKAVIFHEKNLETLVLSVTFRGNASDFSWVVPTPTKPEVEKSTDELFTALEELTQPGIGYPVPLYEGTKMAPAGRGVEVIETKKVEYYDIAILSADDPEALTKWLNENGYQFPNEANYLLDDYIKEKWYFTAVKISAEGLRVAETELREGHAVPLKFTFVTSKIVYPLKISKVAEYIKQKQEAGPYMGESQSENAKTGESAVAASCSSHDECAGLFCPQVIGQDTPCCIEGQCVCGPSDCRETPPKIKPVPVPPPFRPYVSILLYVFSDHKKDLPGFNVEWANWVKSKDIEKLAIESDGEPWIKPKLGKYYLTKLTRYMSPSEMTYDLYFRDASDNKPVGVKRFEWLNAFMAVLIFLAMFSIFLVIGSISPGGIIFIICTILQFFTKLKIIHILAWILQSLIFLLTFGLGILWLATRERFFDSFVSWAPYSWQVTYSKVIFAAGLSAWVLFLLGMVGIMIWQIFHQLRQHKHK